MTKVLRWRTETVSTAPSDAELAARAQQDRVAFGLLYDRYVALIYRYCLIRLRDQENAEDATSVVFARALAALPNHRGPSFRSWLFAIAHNVVIDAQRGARAEVSLSVLTELAARDPSPEDQVAAADRRHRVLDALAHLTQDQRQVIELRLAGLTGPEIAAALGQSHAAVRTTQRRAVSRLRAHLDTGSTMEERRDAS